MKGLLEAKGIIKDEKHINIRQPKTCPNCRESNKPDAQFCLKCNFVMSFEAYHKGQEERVKKDQELKELKEQMVQSRQEIKDRFQEYDSKIAEFVHDIQLNLSSEKSQHEVRSQVMKRMWEILDRVAPEWYEQVIGPKEHK